MDEETRKKLEAKWADKYLCFLAALDHCNEIIALNKRRAEIKAELPAESKEVVVEQMNKTIDNELTDLKIILDYYLKGKENIVTERMNKFASKLEPQN
jgi:hypothetical protein